MIDYWYAGDFVYKDPALSYVPAVVHVLSEGRYLTLTPLEEPVAEVSIARTEEEKEKKEKEPVAVLYFDFNRWNVKRKEREKLKTLEKEKTYSLVGHACWIGKEAYNKNLSLKRAEEVERVMKEMGFQVEKKEGRGEEKCKQKKNLWQCRKVEVYQW